MTTSYVCVVVFKMQNASGGINQDCLAAMPADEEWKCGFSNVCSYDRYYQLLAILVFL